MNWKNSKNHYGAASIGLHWLMLLLLAAVYACMELRVNYPKGSAIRDGLKTWHYMLGFSVFILVWLRLLVQRFGPTPDIEPALPLGQARLAGWMKIALYVLMLCMPLLGWLLLSAEAKPVLFFGWEMPVLIGKDKALAKQIKEVHEIVGTAGYFLIGLHAAAALYHHFVVGDNTLRRMLPRQT
jgi:superoxide oxidase